ncbi:BnaC02g41960D [Brassica napus]|uniref:BnaC02g41960D protein n=1 Tax=Brassica napus TaxID=3708 RepID=A0A078IB07_BRANA|nr:BnaC02g41960D [Brassica napus]
MFSGNQGVLISNISQHLKIHADSCLMIVKTRGLGTLIVCWSIFTLNSVSIVTTSLREQI